DVNTNTYKLAAWISKIIIVLVDAIRRPVRSLQNVNDLVCECYAFTVAQNAGNADRSFIRNLPQRGNEAHTLVDSDAAWLNAFLYLQQILFCLGCSLALGSNF